MRGDSIRDLYAKTLALLGLGVLAGAGALVDHWPSRVTLPPAASPWLAAELPGPLGVESVGVPAAAIASVAGHARLTMTRSESVQPVAVAAAAEPVRVVPAAFDAAAFGASIAMPRPEWAVVSTAQDAAPPMFLEGSIETIVESLVESEPLVSLATSSRSSVPSADGVVDSDDPLSAAFKKTGSSIARGGMATGSSIASAGASIVDGFRAVSRLFKRALPTN